MQSQVQQLLTGLAQSLQAQTNSQLPTAPSGWSIVGPAQPSALHQQAALPADGSWASFRADHAGQQAPAPTTVRAESGVPAEAAQPLLLSQPSTPAPGHAVDQGTVQCELPAEGLTSDTLSIDPVALRCEAAAIEVVAGKATSTQPPAQPSAGEVALKAPGTACSSQPAVQPAAQQVCGGLGCSSGTISVDIVGLRSQAPAVCSSTTISVDIVGLASQVPAQLPAPSALGTDTGYPPAEGTPQQADTQQADTTCLKQNLSMWLQKPLLRWSQAHPQQNMLIQHLANATLLKRARLSKQLQRHSQAQLLLAASGGGGEHPHLPASAGLTQRPSPCQKSASARLWGSCRRFLRPLR